MRIKIFHLRSPEEISSMVLLKMKSCDKGHPFFDSHFRQRYTQDCPFCVLPCCHVTVLKAREIDASSPKQESTLLSIALSKMVSVFALFGGQGSNEVYFDELQNLYDIYKPFVASFDQPHRRRSCAPSC
jgi:hypothetical protein